MFDITFNSFRSNINVLYPLLDKIGLDLRNENHNWLELKQIRESILFSYKLVTNILHDFSELSNASLQKQNAFKKENEKLISNAIKTFTDYYESLMQHRCQSKYPLNCLYFNLFIAPKVRKLIGKIDLLIDILGLYKDEDGEYISSKELLKSLG